MYRAFISMALPAKNMPDNLSLNLPELSRNWAYSVVLVLVLVLLQHASQPAPI